MPSGWKQARIKEVGTVITGSTPPTKDLDNYGDEFMFVSPADMGSHKYIRSSVKMVSKKGFDIGRMVPPKSTLFTCIGSTIGKIGMNEVELITNQQINSVIPNSDVDPDFIYYSLENVAQRIKKLAGQQAVPLINKSDFEEETITLPVSKNEQEKIAKILSTWDEAIEKLDAATKLVSGLKQNLLHQIIYKNQFHHKAEWSLKPVSELFDILDNKRKPLNSSQRQNMKGDVPYYGANGQVGTVDDFIFNEPLILLAEDGGYFDEYKTRPIAYRIFGKSWVNNHAHVLKAKEGFNFDYLYFAFVHKNIMPFLNGGTRAKLNKAVLEKIEIPIPNRPDEQKAIANLFNSLEQRESLLKQKTSLLQTQKQGLMQQLLTGKKRVKV